MNDERPLLLMDQSQLDTMSGGTSDRIPGFRVMHVEPAGGRAAVQRPANRAGCSSLIESADAAVGALYSLATMPP